MASFAKIIKIASLPHGDAPESVRRGWLGCILPTAGVTCGHVPRYTRSVVPRKKKGLLTANEFIALNHADDKIDGFDVWQEIALQVLSIHSPLAAKWFYEHGHPVQDKDWNCFGFKLAEVEILRAYTEAELMKLGPFVQYDDMETGTMRAVPL